MTHQRWSTMKQTASRSKGETVGVSLSIHQEPDTEPKDRIVLINYLISNSQSWRGGATFFCGGPRGCAHSFREKFSRPVVRTYCRDSRQMLLLNTPAIYNLPLLLAFRCIFFDPSIVDEEDFLICLVTTASFLIY